jgi:tRNA pseudouridine(55) synthase
MDFAPTTYYDGQQVMAREGDGFTGQSGIPDLEGAVVCTNAGTTTEKNITETTAAAGVNITLNTFEDFNQVMDQFISGACDAVTTDGSGLVGRKATREQDRFMGLPKVYSGAIRLGETTASYDVETPVEETNPTDHLTESDLEAARQKFLGEIDQYPPMFSAIKVGGERLYKKARRGEMIEIKPRHVTISRFDLAEIRGSDVDFLVHCSKGTYIRSLAHDLGEELGVGGHLVSLRREAVGPYRVEDAWGLEEIEDEGVRE